MSSDLTAFATPIEQNSKALQPYKHYVTQPSSSAVQFQQVSIQENRNVAIEALFKLLFQLSFQVNFDLIELLPDWILYDKVKQKFVLTINFF